MILAGYDVDEAGVQAGPFCSGATGVSGRAKRTVACSRTAASMTGLDKSCGCRDGGRLRCCCGVTAFAFWGRLCSEGGRIRRLGAVKMCNLRGRC